jgi:hypothetical protein
VWLQIQNDERLTFVVSMAVFDALKALKVLLPFQEKGVEFAVHRRHAATFALEPQPKGFILADEMYAVRAVYRCVWNIPDTAVSRCICLTSAVSRYVARYAGD